MTDQRLAEIQHSLTKQRVKFKDVEYLITALRSERKVIEQMQSDYTELEAIAKTQAQTIDMMDEQNTALHSGLETERAKVAELESTNQWMHGLIKTYQSEKAELQKELETYRWIEKHRKEKEHCSYCCGTGLKQIEVIDEPGQPPTDGK